jgi:hypothetical protein
MWWDVALLEGVFLIVSSALLIPSSIVILCLVVYDCIQDQPVMGNSLDAFFFYPFGYKAYGML